MKRIALFVTGILIAAVAIAQASRQEIIEKRAREMHRVIVLNDAEQWKKFIQENYTQALIDKPVRANVQTNESGEPQSSSSTREGNLDSKVKMFGNLHDDFGRSRIASLKTINGAVEMILESETTMRGTFRISFEEKAPYHINGIGIEVGD